jgi:hypothetical protein
LSPLDRLPYIASDTKDAAGLPGKGDAVVVCRPDGSSSFFLLDVDHRQLHQKLKDGADLSAEEFGQLEAAHKAMTLYLVGQNEKIMDALTEMVNGPGFLDADELRPFN